MASLDQLQAALVNADRAGDTEAARALAHEIVKMRAAPAASSTGEGAMSSLAIGAGRTVDRLAAGLKQGVLGIGGILSEALPQSLKEKAQGALTDELMGLDKQMGESNRLYQPLQEEHPVATGVGEALPLAAAPMLRLAGGAGALPAMANAAASAAAPGALEYGTAGERGKRAAIGAVAGAAGGALGAGVGRAIQPLRAPLSEAQQASNAAAERLGVNLSPGEQTGNRALKWMESSVADMPLAAGKAQARSAANDAALSTAALRSIGQAGSEITPQALGAARQNISGTFDHILNPLKITLDKSFEAEVKAISSSKVMKGLRDESIDSIIKPFQNLPQGKVQVTGEWFQQNRSALDAQIRSSYLNGEAPKAMALEGFERALDRAAKRSMTPDEGQAYDLARKQWANLRTLETGSVVENGRVLPGRLNQALQTRYKGAYKEGKIQGDLTDIASLASSLRAPPQSGSIPRAMYSSAAGGAAFMHPMASAAMLAGPPAIQSLLMSPAGKKYLTQGLLNVTPEMEEGLIRGGGGLFGLPALGLAQ